MNIQMSCSCGSKIIVQEFIKDNTPFVETYLNRWTRRHAQCGKVKPSVKQVILEDVKNNGPITRALKGA